MSARETMLAAIRRSLGASGTDPARRAIVADRIARAPRAIVPARGQLDPAARIDLFQTRATAGYADVQRVTYAAIPAAIASYLAARNLPATIRTGTDRRIAALDWSATAIEVATGPVSPADSASLSHADAGIAETGTLMLASGPENPTLLNFLPPVHIAIVAAADIIGDPETAIDRLRQRYGKGRMPRVVNLITGPSRSGDIEQTMYLGAHGPHSLLVLIAG
jgi:L-lactate dehydrogenase complex protein LldG